MYMCDDYSACPLINTAWATGIKRVFAHVNSFKPQKGGKYITHSTSVLGNVK
jgi:hypothetical protein